MISYECDNQTNWLAPDSICKDCTLLTEEEIVGTKRRTHGAQLAGVWCVVLSSISLTSYAAPPANTLPISGDSGVFLAALCFFIAWAFGFNAGNQR